MVNLPKPFGDIPREKLLFPHPTAIEHLPRLSARLSSDNESSKVNVYVKREDCNSGLAYGGNKIRKLEYVLADAVQKGADTLVTTGGQQSNHMRQTGAAAAKLGMKVVLYPQNRVDDAAKHQEYSYAGNIQINEILGAETLPIDTPEEEVIASLKASAYKPYSIPSGASTHPLGGLGYARCAFEILEQEAELGTTFDTIVLATGSGSTIGGLVAGFKLASKQGLLAKPKRLIGVSVLRADGDEARRLVLDIARTAAGKIGLDPEEITHADFEVDVGYLGPGYGILDEPTELAVKELARTEGVLTDPVYTGKTACGLLDYARKGKVVGNVLFIHTGGQVALSAYPQLK